MNEYSLLYTKNEWMNEYLTRPQHKKQIGYWVSKKGKRMKWPCSNRIKSLVNVYLADLIVLYWPEYNFKKAWSPTC